MPPSLRRPLFRQDPGMAKSARKKPLRQQPAFKKLKELLKQPDLPWYHRVNEWVDKLSSPGLTNG
jgi:hypothetical protein